MSVLRRSLPLSALCLLAGAQASAQVYINTTRTEPYVQLANLPGITNITTLTFTDLDEGQAPFTLPFPFTFMGNTFTQANLGANACLTFGTAEGVPGFTNQAPGTAASPNNWIAPLWDDLWYPTNTSAQMGIIGTAPNRILVIEAGPGTRFAASGGTLFTQVWLYEGPTRRFEYRSTGNPVNALSATIGYEGPGGVPSFNAGNCSAGTGCAVVPSGTTFVTFIANDPELTGSIGTFPRGAFPGGTAIGQVLLRNQGVDTATTVTTSLYLSTNNTYEATDPLVGTLVADVPAGTRTVTATITVPPGTAAGDYFLIARIDSNNHYAENIETDNTFVATQRFATAYDLVASGVAAVGNQGANPGDSISFDISVRNDGIQYAGTLEVELFASRDQIFDVNDASLGTAQINLTGTLNETARATIVLPSLAPGAYFPIVSLDSARLVNELNETNNATAGAISFPTGPDFAITTVGIPAQAVPGMPFTITTRVDSAAVTYNGPVSYRLLISTDNLLDPGDTTLGTYVVNFAGNDFLDDVQNPVFPLALPPGRYFVIAVSDPLNSIVELSEANNFRASATTLLNAPDFGVGTVTFTPATLDRGGTLNITSTLLSVGTTFTGAVPFRVYLSPDNQFDLGDTAIYDGVVQLFGLSTAPITAAIPLPIGTPPAEYHVAIQVDPDGATAEAVEENNTNVSTTRFVLRAAEVRVVSVTGEPVAFIGQSYRLTSVIRNDGPAPANGFHYAIYFSPNEIIRVTDKLVHLSGTTTIAAGEELTFVDDVPSCASAPEPCITVLTATATMWLGTIADINFEIPDPSRGNNIRHTDPIEFLFPIPDLRAEIIETATSAAAGELLAVTRVMENLGTDDAPSFTYTYYLSSNPTIATDDIVIGTFNGALAEGADDFGIDRMLLPSDLPAGTYYLGMIMDPGDLVAEVSEDNNIAVGPQLPVYSATIQITTTTLPSGVIGVEYQVGVYASGGPLGVTWSVPTGALPDGLTIDPVTGLISGTPTREGLFSFVLRASSGSASTDRPFTIRVTSPTVQLRIATPNLGTAVVGRPYELVLVAVGGVQPYTWSITSDMPSGLNLTANGVLEGTPRSAAGARISVRVEDTVGNTANRDFALNIKSSDDVVAIQQNGLNPGIVGEPYCQPDPIKLLADGGTPAYTWSLISNPPPGMSLASDGAFCGTPEEAGSFAVVVRAQDQTGLFDTSLIIFEVKGRDFAIATFNLDPGTVGTPYSGDLTAVRGTTPYRFSLVDGLGALPAGLTLAEGGAISGTPSTAGVFAFVVLVVDADQRSDVQALSVEIQEAPVVITPEEGCSCSAAERTRQDRASLALLALGGLLLALRRRRALSVALGLALALPLAAQAQTQVPGTPYTRTQSAIVYTPLSSPTTLFSSGDDSSVTVTLPFSFKFYDTEFTDVSVGTNAAIIFGAGQSISLSNVAPGTSTPNGFIAPFWDDQIVNAAADHGIGTFVEGTAPNRAWVVEYKNISRFGTPGVLFNFQLRLYEGSAGRLTIDYGPITGTASFSATMGMEDPAGGRVILFAASNCTNTCTQTDFSALNNTRIELIQDPGIELVAQSVSAPPLGFLGAQVPVSVQVTNLHGQAIGPFGVQILASSASDMSNPTVIATSSITLAAFQSSSFQVQAVPPLSLGEGLFYIGLVVDPNNAVPEVNELNNTAVAPGQIRLRNGAPDLAAMRVTTAVSAVTAGGTVQVHVRLQNLGGIAANNVTVALMLSANPVISPQDVQLSTYVVSLGPQQVDERDVTVTIPPTTNSGAYYLGALADSDQMVDELSESNNGRASLSPVTVSGATLAIVTQRLPSALVLVAYQERMVAVGGGTSYSWRISQGTLPAGIGIVGPTGALYGRAQHPDVQTFTVEVSSDGQTATRQFTLAVVEPSQPLTVVSRDIPPGVVEQEYSFALVATGGTRNATLAWSASNLPAGFELTGDGILAGTPVAAGSSTVTVQVSDGTSMASRDLLLVVRDNANLLIKPDPLPGATFGVAYSHQFEATGGMPPIQWLVSLGSLPEGLELTPSGLLSGTPQQVGRFLITVEARDSAAGSARAKDENAYTLVVDNGTGFSIVTASLPDAFQNQGYDQSIHAEGGEPPYQWSRVEGELPQGLNEGVNPTTNDYRIAGQAEVLGTTTLLMRVTDSRGRIAEHAYAIRVLPTPVPVVTEETGGCGCTSSAQSTSSPALLLGALACLLLRRRR